MDRARSIRTAALAGIVGPVAFLLVAFASALVRPDVIRAQGWVSWPSSMALGGRPGIPQIVGFLVLAASYPIFALGAVRPALGDRMAWGGFLGIAVGDALLAAPTDGVGNDPTWFGAAHLVGVFVATAASLVAAAGVTRATLGDPAWRTWRRVGAPAIAIATAVGAVAGFTTGWAKVVYVLGITVPVPLVAILLRRSRAPVDPRRQATTGPPSTGRPE
ncbi:MAG TPA: hypothetical protein VEC09_04640 [Actinomycetota bacterium]|nr:hypothetical protein [Actinomycetota bacterium]